jgi:hypothetical protein
MVNYRGSFHIVIDTDDWFGGLITTLASLRHSWEHNWVGLPAVLSVCQRTMGLLDLHHTRADVINDFASKIATQIENDPTPQPRYHNSLHMADVLVTLTLLMRMQLSHPKQSDWYWIACLLASATGHDLDHPGGFNRFDSEFETRSCRAMVEKIDASGMLDDDIECIQKLILSTEVRLVAEHHQLVAGKNFEWDLPWCTVLLNEADILASATAEFGPSLGYALAQELKEAGNPAGNTIASANGRRQFLSSLRFSSPSAQQLGMPQRVQQQLDLLR